MLGLAFIVILLGLITVPELILMPIAICALIVSENNKKREFASNKENKAYCGTNSAFLSCSYEDNNDEEYDYGEMIDSGFCASSCDDESSETDYWDSLLSEPDHTDDFSIYVNDSGLPTYWNDDGDIWGAPFGGI